MFLVDIWKWLPYILQVGSMFASVGMGKQAVDAYVKSNQEHDTNTFSFLLLLQFFPGFPIFYFDNFVLTR